MEKRITRIDEWMKQNGIYEEFEKAKIRKSNFAPENWDDDIDVMRGKVAAYIRIMEKRNDPLHDQLTGSFVFSLTPQGNDFWWNIYHQLLHERLNNRTT